MKPIETEYKGYRFRSQLEAKWAVLFDAFGVSWDYELEGFEMPNGARYLPDFLLHDVDGRCGILGGDLYVEVKGVPILTSTDRYKITSFVTDGYGADYLGNLNIKNPLLIVNKIPEGEDLRLMDFSIREMHDRCADYFTFTYVDNDKGVACFPAINRDGHFELFADDPSYLNDRNYYATELAYTLARQARFDHGQTPTFEEIEAEMSGVRKLSAYTEWNEQRIKEMEEAFFKEW